MYSSAELLTRGTATLLASWEEYARGATGASLQRLAGVPTAVFPNEPERSVYNNALLEHGLAAEVRSRAIDAMEAAYAAAGVRSFARSRLSRRRGLCSLVASKARACHGDTGSSKGVCEPRALRFLVAFVFTGVIAAACYSSGRPGEDAPVLMA